MFKPEKLNVWHYLRQHRVTRIVAGHVVVLAVLAVVMLGSVFGGNPLGAFAQASCASGDRTYSVQWGDTLNSIAQRNQTTWQNLASHNELGNPNLIFLNQNICIPGSGVGTRYAAQTVTLATAPMSVHVSVPVHVSAAVVGFANIFAYGQCTWWANQRYHQLHGVYVPWTSNADAGQWVARATQFHWHISSHPTAGAIVVLAPDVQGASWVGHVAVVEHILRNGHVVASNMNWGPAPGAVTNVEFTPGRGVFFVTR